MSFAVVFVLHGHRACLTASDIFLLKNFGPACNGAAGHFWHHVLQPESFVLGCNLLLSNVLPFRHRSIPCTNESAQPATSTIPYHCFFSAIGSHRRLDIFNKITIFNHAFLFDQRLDGKIHGNAPQVFEIQIGTICVDQLRSPSVASVEC